MSQSRTLSVIALLSNEKSVAQVAQEHGVSEAEVASWRELYLQGARSTAQRTPWRPGKGSALWGVALASLGALSYAGVAFAQSVTCSQTLPAPLVTMCANGPALASDVNGNFQAVYNWINQKVGTPGTNNVSIGGTATVSGVTTLQSNASVAGNLSVTGASTFGNNVTISGNESFGAATRQMINLWNSDYGIGVQNSTTYFRSGGNFAFFRGGVHNDVAFNAGAGGTALMTVDTSGNVATAGQISAATSVKSRGSSVVREISSCCGGSGGCCPGGWTQVGPDLNTGAGGSYCFLCVIKAD